MGEFESELRRRLASGDSVEDTARWFIECMARTPRPDLSPFETKFWRRIVAAYLKWRAGRTLT
jgi:hypothetical protein